MLKQLPHLDANETIFFVRELEAVKSKSYDVVYAELKARKLFPVSGEAGPAAETIRYEQYDTVGLAKVIANYADDLPRADVKGKEFVSIVKSLGSSYGYNLQEVRAAKATGKPLEQRRANAAKRAIEEKINSIAFNGDSASNIPGFLSNSNVGSYTIPAGVSTTTPWSTKTADEILADMHGVANQIVDTTKGVEAPDTLLIPIAQYNLIATKRIGVDSNMTVLRYFMETSPYIKNVEWVNELDGAGTAGKDVIVAYKRDPDKLTLEIPQEFEQLEVQPKGLEYVVPCHARIGGVLIYYPLSICKGEGI